MKKVLKNRIFIVIITLIIGVSGTLYATTKYQASEVLYNGSNGKITVREALNEIYNIKTLGDATSDDIMEGKTAVVQGKLITGSATGTSSYVYGSTSVTNSSKTKSITFPVPVGYTYCFLEHNGAINTEGDSVGINYSYDYDSEAGILTVTIVSSSQPYYRFWNRTHKATYLCVK